MKAPLPKLDGMRAVAAPRRLGSRPALDGVRALAIVAVMGLHALAALFRGGSYGVDIFFVLSAFLITSLILQEVYERGGEYDFRSFYARRALRLMPALIVWLALIAAPTAIAAGEAHVIPVATLASLFYVGDFVTAAGVNIGTSYVHVWSLGVEEQFYLLWPALLIWATVRLSIGWRYAWLRLAVPLAVAVQFLAAHQLTGSYFLPTGHLVPLAVGCLAAHLFAFRLSPRLEKVICTPAVAWASLVGLVAIVCGVRQTGSNLSIATTSVVAVLTGGLILHACAEGRSTVRWLLTLPAVRWLGTRSYGLYLYHRTLAVLVAAVCPGIKLHYGGPLTLILAFVVAELSYRLVERPIRRAGRARLRSAHRPIAPVD